MKSSYLVETESAKADQRPMRLPKAVAQRSFSVGLLSFESVALNVTFKLLSACCCRSMVTAAPALVPVIRPLARSALVISTPTSAAAPSAASQDRSKLGGVGTVVVGYPT